MNKSRFLHIAEKNSIAKEVAEILSNGRKRTGITLSKFNPVFHFERQGQQHTFSSVRGHIFQYELPKECANWKTFDCRRILSRQTPLSRKNGTGMDDLVANLEKIARNQSQIVLWLDCDRQGEAIAYQVLDIVCLVNPHLRVRRARFAAVTPADINRAYQNLVNPNPLQADAVNYRMEVDLRLGCAFTRFQTIAFQRQFRFKQRSVVSYGPCQFPTLAFVVNRYFEIINFKPQKYWFLQASAVLEAKTRLQFKWQCGRCDDETEACIRFVQMYEKGGGADEGRVKGRVLQRNQNQKKRYRPFPLTTITFQKLATDKLKMSSAQAMKIAEQLYQKGFISYPRTQTNSFPSTMNLPGLVKQLDGCSEYRDYVNSLLQGGKFQKPKVGSQSDQAHTPIHPVRGVDRRSLTNEEWRVYDLVSRHFLACCSRDALGLQSQIVADVGGERFKATQLRILQKNYLQIYIFERWVEGEFPGEVPQEFWAAVDLGNGETKPPAYLSESDLIQLMEKNQIGTDSTIHEHIQTIQTRKYAVKTQNTFKPTNLGAALVSAYRALDLPLPDCKIRRDIEARMEQIAGGRMGKLDAIDATLSEALPLYRQLKTLEDSWVQQLGQALIQHKGLPSSDLESIQDYSRRAQDDGEDISNNTSTSIICYRCGLPGHLAPNCPERGQPTQPIQQQRQPQQRQPQRRQPQRRQPQQRQPQQRQPQQRQPKKQQNKQKSNTRVYTCFICKKQGHIAPDCPEKGRGKKQESQTKKEGCFSCGEQGHFAMNCPNGKKENTHFNRTGQNTFKCFTCGEAGHISPNCPKGRFFSNQLHQVGPSHQGQQKEKKVCPDCGVIGRHPRNAQCGKVRKRQKSPE